MREWDKTRIKDLLSFCSGDTLTSEMLVEDGDFPVYGGNGVRGQYNQFNKEGNYILVGRVGALCGNIHNVTGRFWATEHALIGTPIDKFDSRWLAYILQDMNLGQYSIASAQPVLSITKITRLELPFPPYAEQRAIADYLDTECGKIGKKIELLERKADAYTRLRRSLINRAVTRGLNPDVELKASNLRWIPNIPTHWNIGRIRNFFDYRNEKVSEIAFAPLSVTKNGVVPQMENVAKSMAEGDTRKKVCTNDFVVNSRSDRKGSCGTAPLDGSVSLIYIVLEPKNINPRFSNYYFRCNDWVEEFYRNGKGIVADLWTTNYSIMRNIEIALPPIEEQEDIASYLDEMCSKIDVILEKIRKQVERLKELKRSLINEVVTGQRAI